HLFRPPPTKRLSRNHLLLASEFWPAGTTRSTARHIRLRPGSSRSARSRHYLPPLFRTGLDRRAPKWPLSHFDSSYCGGYPHSGCRLSLRPTPISVSARWPRRTAIEPEAGSPIAPGRRRRKRIGRLRTISATGLEHPRLLSR